MAYNCLKCEDPSWTGQPALKAQPLDADTQLIKGYFYNDKFYRDAGHVYEIYPMKDNVYVDITDEEKPMLYIFEDGAYIKVGSKLYNEKGDNDDGAMTQAAATAEYDRLDERIDNIELASDVVDIVGTYAALLAYDTTNLKNNDIIKVLADETHNNAISYYRWNKPETSWVFIASVGPYYTKAETDELLDDKQDILTAGDNITIENNVISAASGIILGGTTAPTTSTVGVVSQLYSYYDTDRQAPVIAMCVKAEEVAGQMVYTWVPQYFATVIDNREGEIDIDPEEGEMVIPEDTPVEDSTMDATDLAMEVDGTTLIV